MADSEAKSGGVEAEPETTSDPENEAKSSMVAPPKFVFGQNMEGRVQLKRQAEEQLNPDSVKEDGDSSEEPGEFKKAVPTILTQRLRATPSGTFKDKTGNVGAFPAPSKLLFSTGSPPDSQPTSPTSTTSKTGSFSGQTLSFATTTTGSPSLTTTTSTTTGDVSSVKNTTTTTTTTTNTNTFQPPTTASVVTTTGSFPPQNNSTKNVFAASTISSGASLPELSKNVFSTHGHSDSVPTIASNVFAKHGTADTSTSHSGTLSIAAVGATSSSGGNVSSGAPEAISYRTHKTHPGSGYSSVENSDTEQDDPRPILRTPMLVVSSVNNPVLSTVSSSSSSLADDSKDFASSGSRNLLKPSALTSQTIALQSSKFTPVKQPVIVSALSMKKSESKENEKEKDTDKEVENGTDSTQETSKSECESSKAAETTNTTNSASTGPTFNTGTKGNFFVRLEKPTVSNTWSKLQSVSSKPGGKDNAPPVFGAGKDTDSPVNYWAQYSKSTSVDEDEEEKKNVSPEKASSSFVFGRHVTDRIVTPSKRALEKDEDGEEGGQEKEETDEGATSTERLSKRVKGEDDVLPKEDSDQESISKLKESASAYEEAKESSRLKLDEVATVTGEESEENVLQAQCKLFLFEPSNQSWLEKGRGMLRINDKSQASDVMSFKSRLVMRTQGSLRVILNTKIWPAMVVEKASSKTVRITALGSEGAKVYLVMANPKDAEQIFSAIDYRVQALKRYAEMQEDRSQCTSTQESDDNTEEKSEVKEEQTNTEDDSKSSNEEQPTSTTSDQA
ncbi:uncharacterized protein LOC144436941 [Glandiceps talaboti]